MKINEVIEKIKKYSRGYKLGSPCSDKRDKIIYGNGDVECTGIVTTVHATIDVLREAARLHANMVIVNESLLWSHGDPTEWLEDNEVFQEKKRIMDENGITVWRYHEFNRSGVKFGDSWVDPVNYGLCKKLGWTDRIGEAAVKDDDLYTMYTTLHFNGETVREIAAELKEKLQLNGIRLIGDGDRKVHKMFIPPCSFMAMGDIGGVPIDSVFAKVLEDNDFDCVMALELVDFTIEEYIRDSVYTNDSKAMIHIGHFNMEEPGMEYIAEILPEALETNEIEIHYVNSGDPFEYVYKR